ncbi:unnamed protein product [Enterobius vermicularis]|uniref:Forkhead box protein fkh-2 n=1 Tax=Enterobius vermicularis TaxID=51028 RepID=A0A3P6JDN6_ENTVE|nr:unnamed protein product [Enterobius vermicularis]
MCHQKIQVIILFFLFIYFKPTTSNTTTTTNNNNNSIGANNSNANCTVDYSTHPKKPPYSYSQLIVQAMKHFGGQKVLLTDIYGYIRERYAWYRLCDPSWQNSIRHNLSLNKQFIKIPRSAEDKGKGSYWKLDFSR